MDICFDVMEKKKTNNSPCSSAYGISNIADRIPTFKAVLFDMDGVLYNSMPNHAVAWVRAMKDFGMHFTPEDSYATEGARGVDTIRVFAKKQLGKDLTEEEAQKIYDVKTRYFHELRWPNLRWCRRPDAEDKVSRPTDMYRHWQWTASSLQALSMTSVSLSTRSIL